jgi:hypothetical protein
MQQNVLQFGIPFKLWRNIAFIVLFFAVTPLALFSSILTLITVTDEKDKPVFYETLIPQHKNLNLYAAMPVELPGISGEVAGVTDARQGQIRNYLLKHNSPLVPYADLIVATADKYDLDYRLLTAIAQQESNLCKKIPENSYNCWGWGIHSRGTLRFTSYAEGIDTVSRGLKEKYINKGYVTPDEIMKKYTPLSNGSWAFGVNQFIRDIQ